ncbi:MAG: murein biosynthesis integral membrane protein MurJ, partial [Nocardiopsaceae bacterium]|nr:murein biosynthesis integral membrane protein MurJ [Nocardiopsaceae bacterium]
PAPTTSFMVAPGFAEPSFQPYPGPEAAPEEAERPPAATRVRVTGPQRAPDTQPNLARSSKAMAIGTIASRGTGFLRTFVLAIALGSGPLADAYNNSNTLPNTVYYLFLGGIFTSVVVPLLVSAAKNHPDKGQAYAERIFTLGAVVLLIVTVAGTALAGPIADLYSGGISGDEHRVMVIFAYFFIPQIFFYGMDALLGAILNVRGRFGPNMWTPVINNVVVIIVFALFVVVDGLHRTPQDISPGGLQLLGIGTTIGVVIQSLALFPIVKRAGFSFRLRFDFRRAELSEIGRMAGWMLGYVVSQWAGNLVLQIVANTASSRPDATPGTGYTAYSIALQLFQLPYAIVGLSVISALLPRMSGHATDRRYSLVREDFSTGVRVASVIVVPAAVFLGVLGAPLCEFLFSYGSLSVNEARYIGEVFGLLSLGLMPFMLTQLQLRVFYSFHNNRTPAIVGVVMFAVGAIGDFVALAVLSPSSVVLGLGAVYGLMTLVGAVIAWPLLLRHVGSLDGRRITRSLVRMFLATLPGLGWIFVTMAVAGTFTHQGPVYGFVSTVVGGGGALLLFALCARLLGIEEFRVLLRTVGGRFGR